MFLATVLLYPCVLAALCVGTALLVERAAGAALPGGLLLPVGAAGAIAVSQLCVLAYPLAPATPFVLAAVALCGLLSSRARLAALSSGVRARPLALAVSLLAYCFALAPVLAAGRPSFSSYMALADSAVHLAGAEYLISHGLRFAHLDLANSYGQFMSGYYNNSYPSGADTLLGGSAPLLGLPLIWAFQPFNAFMLACGVGPAWLLARRVGLRGAWAALAALTIVLPALVYAYELLGSVKEVTALALILTLGVFVAGHERWLGRGARRGLPFAIVLAGGVSALGVAFGVWALVATVVLAAIMARRCVDRAQLRSVLALLALAAVALAIAALPTWIHLRGSITVASNIAGTSNSGNLRSALRASQALGVWLGGSYKLVPHGADWAATRVLIVIVLGAAALGVFNLLRRRAFALAAWIALSLIAWLLITRSATTWAAAKALMLTSPVVLLLAWSGVAALRSMPARAASWALAGGLALALGGGVLVSDALQYHSANLAPTARYQELASLDARFAGRGPTLFTDFDEYSLYELRDLDIGGPNFVYPPPALAAAAGGYGLPVRLDAIAPQALRAYPLIVTRRDPAAPRPPAAYRLAWQGSYYEVWERRPGARAALVHVALSGSARAQCVAVGRLAATAPSRARIAAAAPPPQVSVDLARSSHPRGWGHARRGLAMNRAGTLYATVNVPFAGVWDVWVRGQLMPAVVLALDGRRLASIAGQLSGNSLVPNVAPPFPVRLAAGRHVVSVRRGGFALAPGGAGGAVLDGIVLSPAGRSSRLYSRASAAWRSLCGRRYSWVELIGAPVPAQNG